MKLNVENHKVEAIGDLQQREFRIQASATSFAILSSGLYSNKIRAVIRELACNAKDSHVAAGKPDEPISIKLPTQMDPEFYVQDFGIGLSHDEIMTIYTTYFESTKNDSDDYVGQLGLGSKSPFSYTTQFTVETIKDGKKGVYSMYVTESGIPAVSCIGTMDTDEGNTVKVSIAVKTNDIYRFASEAEHALKYLVPYPTVTGAHHYARPIDYVMKDDRWGIRSGNTSGINVIQGPVQYPIDIAQLKEYDTDDVSLTPESLSILEAPVDLFVPIGLVQVAPSREHLSYDKRTMQNIICFINEITFDIVDSLQAKTNTCSTLWEARLACSVFMKADSVFRLLYQNLVSRKVELQYNGSPVSCYVDMVKAPLNNIIVSYHTGDQRRGSYINRFTNRQFSIPWQTMASSRSLYNEDRVMVNERTTIMYVDTYVSQMNINRYLTDSYSKGEIIIVVRSDDKMVDASAQVESFIEYLGMSMNDVLKTSALIKEGEWSKTPSALAPRKINRKMRAVWNNSSQSDTHSYKTSHWSRAEVDFEDGGYYVLVNNVSWVWDFENRDPRPGLDLARTLLMSKGIITKGDDIIGITKIDLKKYSASDKWVNIGDLIDSCVADNVNDIIESEAARIYKGARSALCNIAEYIDLDKAGVSDSSPFKSYIRVMTRFATVTQISGLSVNKLMQVVSPAVRDSVSPDIDKGVKSYEKLMSVDSLDEHYPMFSLIYMNNLYHNSRACAKKIVDYVKMVDDHKTQSSVDAAEVEIVEVETT